MEVVLWIGVSLREQDDGLMALGGLQETQAKDSNQDQLLRARKVQPLDHGQRQHDDHEVGDYVANGICVPWTDKC